MNFLKSFFAIFLMLSLTVAKAGAGAFSDVTSQTDYWRAIYELRSQGIVKGYNDGTFKPLNNINRAESLKIIMLSSDFESKGQSNCFEDIPKGAWFQDYVCSAKFYGFINGYDGNLFKPAQEITRAESLKIAMEVMQIPLINSDINPYSDVSLNDWFYKYVVTAKNLELLPFEDQFYPNQFITRGELSEIFYRALNADLTSATATDSMTEPSYVQAFIPEDLNTAVNLKAFSGVTLSSDFTNLFFKNTYKNIKGEVEAGIENLVLGFQLQDNRYFLVSAPLQDGKFDTNILVPNFDNMTFFIIHDKSEVIPAQPINLFEPNFQLSDSRNVDVRFGYDASAYMQVSNFTNPLKIEFSDGTNQTEFFILEPSKFYIPADIFADFQAGDLTYKIYGQELIQESTVQITYKKPNIVSENIILEESTASYQIGQNIKISGQIQQPLETQAFLISPDESYKPISEYYNATDTTFEIYFTPTQKGKYTFKIFTQDNKELLSHTIYSQDVWPVLDYKFMKTDSTNQDSNTIEAITSESLVLINDSRKYEGVGTLELNESLSQLAQYHAENMAKENFFSHTDHLNEGPNDRRVRFGIQPYVGENISLSSNAGLMKAFLGLMDSPGHRANILDEKYDSVGIGVAFNSENKMYYVQVFSTFGSSKTDSTSTSTSSTTNTQTNTQENTSTSTAEPNTTIDTQTQMQNTQQNDVTQTSTNELEENNLNQIIYPSKGRGNSSRGKNKFKY